MAVEIPAQAVADARAGAARAGYPDLWPLLLAVAGPESNWNPQPPGYNDDGSSFGYLQLHVGGISPLFPGAGLGDGHAAAELLDGPTNFAIGAKIIGDRLAAGASLADALQPWSTRPAALALYDRIRAEGIAGEAAAGAPANAVPPALAPLLIVVGVGFAALILAEVLD